MRIIALFDISCYAPVWLSHIERVLTYGTNPSDATAAGSDKIPKEMVSATMTRDGSGQLQLDLIVDLLHGRTY